MPVSWVEWEHWQEITHVLTLKMISFPWVSCACSLKPVPCMSFSVFSNNFWELRKEKSTDDTCSVPKTKGHVFSAKTKWHAFSATEKDLSRQETPNSVCEVFKQKVKRSRRIGVKRGDGGDHFGVILVSLWCRILDVNWLIYWRIYPLYLHVWRNYVLILYFLPRIKRNIKDLPEILLKPSAYITKTNPSAHVDSTNVKTVLYALNSWRLKLKEYTGIHPDSCKR